MCLVCYKISLTSVSFEDSLSQWPLKVGAPQALSWLFFSLLSFYKHLPSVISFISMTLNAIICYYLKTEFLIFPPAKCVLPFTHSFKLESWQSFYTLFHSPSPRHLACYLPYPITNFCFFVSITCISNSSASPPLPPPWFQCHHLYSGVHITCLLPCLSPPIYSPNNS